MYKPYRCSQGIIGKSKQTNGEKVSTLSDVKAMVGARYQLEPAARSQHAHNVLRSSHGESTSGLPLSRY